MTRLLGVHGNYMFCREGGSHANCACGLAILLLFSFFMKTDLLGKNPRNIDYDQSRMRSHLVECFEKEELSLFSPSLVPVKRSRLRHMFVKVCCFCKRPECYDVMVECEGCSTWFHFKCVGLCSSSNTDNWKCSTCSMY